jgi:hypothetical protein
VLRDTGLALALWRPPQVAAIDPVDCLDLALRGSPSCNRSGSCYAAMVMILGLGLFGLLAASMASFLIEKGREKEIDPQISEFERVKRTEALLEGMHPSSNGEHDA